MALLFVWMCPIGKGWFQSSFDLTRLAASTVAWQILNREKEVRSLRGPLRLSQFADIRRELMSVMVRSFGDHANSLPATAST